MTTIKDFKNYFLEQFQTTEGEELIEAVIDSVRWFPSLFIVDIKKFDYNEAKEFLNKLTLANDNNQFVTKKIAEHTKTIGKLEVFKSSQQPIKYEYCDSLLITKWDVIKCVSNSDEQNVNKTIKLIEQSSDNHYYNEITTFLAISIAEGNNYSFQFSNKLSPFSTPYYLNSVLDYNAFIHEAYHSLQHILFDSNNFYDHEETHITKVAYLNALKETYRNVITLANAEQNTTEIEDLLELSTLIRENIPDIDWFEYCIPDNIVLMKKADLKINEVEYYTSYEVPFILDDLKNMDQFFTRNDQYCESIKNKYNYTQEQFTIFGRIDYALDCPNYSLENRVIPDSQCESISLELIPSIFQLMASGISEKEIQIFRPMLNYFDDYVQPILDSHKQSHIENYCMPILAEVNPLLFAQECPAIIGQCIIDINDHEIAHLN